MDNLIWLAIGAAIVIVLLRSGVKLPGLGPAAPPPSPLDRVPAITAYLLAVRAGDAKISAAERLNLDQLTTALANTVAK